MNTDRVKLYRVKDGLQKAYFARADGVLAADERGETHFADPFEAERVGNRLLSRLDPSALTCRSGGIQ